MYQSTIPLRAVFVGAVATIEPAAAARRDELAIDRCEHTNVCEHTNFWLVSTTRSAAQMSFSTITLSSVSKSRFHRRISLF